MDAALSEVKRITGKVLKEDQTRAITASGVIDIVLCAKRLVNPFLCLLLILSL